MNATLRNKVDCMNPGARIVLSQSNGVAVVAERGSGINRREMRIVRESRDGFTVIQRHPVYYC